MKGSNRATWFSIVIFSIGLIVATALASYIQNQEHKSWIASSNAILDQIDDTWLSWLATERLLIRSIALRFYEDEKFNADKFINSVRLHEISSADANTINVAYVTDKSGELEVAMSYGNRQHWLEGGFFKRQEVVLTIEQVSNLPQRAAMGPAYKIDDEFYVLVGMVVPYKDGGGFLLMELDIPSMVQTLKNLYLLSGSRMEFVSWQGVGINVEKNFDRNDLAHILRKRHINDSEIIRNRWLINSDFNGGVKSTTTWLAFSIGILFSTMLSAITFWLMRYNTLVKEQVAARTSDLERAMTQLEDAKDQLVQSEKLASLGSLVAGVSHELNTPLGNALMASTLLKDEVHKVMKSHEGGDLTQEIFVSFLTGSLESTDIIEKSISKASNLIRSFKEIAVDRTSDRKRSFELGKVVDEVLLTMQPKLKRTQHEVKVIIPDNIEMESYPGPLGQVISNFIDNSLVHGFESIEAGKIRIEAYLEDESVILIYADNGKGVSDDIKKKIFDPFFTTKMGAGGSGLGMNLVYNMVTNILEGKIRVEGKEGSGLVLHLRLPVKVSAKSD